MNIKDRFIKFLEVEGIYTRYVKNWKRHEAHWDFKNRIRKKENYLYDGYPFDWQFTPEGFVFWRRYHYKWLRLLKSIEKKDPAEYWKRCSQCGKFVKADEWADKSKFYSNPIICDRGCLPF